MGVVYAFHEKSVNPPGNRANGAVYLLEPEVLDWIGDHPGVSDFSTEVLPQFIGRIFTWHNPGIHRDIGVIQMLQLAQSDPKPPAYWPGADIWQDWFLRHPIHKQVLGGG